MLKNGLYLAAIVNAIKMPVIKDNHLRIYTELIKFRVNMGIIVI